MATKKLYRNTSNQMVGGVCSGLSEYLDIDLVIIRLIFILLFFFGGHGLLIYVILWVLMPLKPPYIEGEFKDLEK